MATKLGRKHIGTFLKYRRRLAGLSQGDLGKALKIHAQFVSNWERGCCKPPPGLFKNLSDILGIPKKDFYHVLCQESAAHWRDILEL